MQAQIWGTRLCVSRSHNIGASATKMSGDRGGKTKVVWGGGMTGGGDTQGTIYSSAHQRDEFGSSRNSLDLRRTRTQKKKRHAPTKKTQRHSTQNISTQTLNRKTKKKKKKKHDRSGHGTPERETVGQVPLRPESRQSVSRVTGRGPLL